MSTPTHMRLALENAQRAERYGAFSRWLGLRPLKGNRKTPHEPMIAAAGGDYTRWWAERGSGRHGPLVVTSEPYNGNAERLVDRLRAVGFEATIVEGIALHYETADVALIVIDGSRGTADFIAANASRIPAICRAPPTRRQIETLAKAEGGAE